MRRGGAGVTTVMRRGGAGVSMVMRRGGAGVSTVSTFSPQQLKNFKEKFCAGKILFNIV
jgi:hypothetical protein